MEDIGQIIDEAEKGKTLAVCALLAIAGVLLIRDHTDHIVQYLPFAIFLLCSLMHVFMHAGHGGHQGHDHGSGESPDEGRKSRGGGR